MILKLMCCCLLCLFCSSLCAAEHELGNKDILAAYLVKWGNTRAAYEDCKTHSTESHFILGECPSKDSINLYYIATLLANFGAKKVMPHEYAKYLGNADFKYSINVQKDYSTVGFKFSY